MGLTDQTLQRKRLGKLKTGIETKMKQREGGKKASKNPQSFSELWTTSRRLIYVSLYFKEETYVHIGKYFVFLCPVHEWPM